MYYNMGMEDKKKHKPYLTEAQKDQVRTWIRAGYTAPQIVGLAKNQGFTISQEVIWTWYSPQVKKDWKDHIDRNSLSKSWFNKEFRAEKASQIADMLFERIMNGEMFQEEVIETPMKSGGIQTTKKPVYFAGMIKNWKDLIDTISAELVSSLFDRIEVSHDRSCHIKFSFADMLGQEETHG